MEKSYFIINKFKLKKGPFKKEDLIGKITRETMLWCPGMTDWSKASNIDDVSFILEQIPPPLPRSTFKLVEIFKRNKVDIKTYLKYFLIFNILFYILLEVFVLIGLYQTNHNGNIYDDVEPKLLLFLTGLIWSTLASSIITPVWLIIRNYKLKKRAFPKINVWISLSQKKLPFWIALTLTVMITFGFILLLLFWLVHFLS